MIERTAEFCHDEALGYQRSRTRFGSGVGLAFDEGYRLAHLPLVAPGHPSVIATKEGAYYDRGRHPRTVSLVLPIANDALRASAAFCAMEAELRSSPVAAKIAWPIVERRRSVLHATICSTLSLGDPSPGSVPDLIDEKCRRALGELGPLAVELRGLFSGDRNIGRLYLKLYPERRNGGNLVRCIQRAVGRPETDLYLVGLYNLVDPLDAGEAAALASLIERWWDRVVLRVEVACLWLLAARDDLVLDGAVEEVISLVRA